MSAALQMMYLVLSLEQVESERCSTHDLPRVKPGAGGVYERCSTHNVPRVKPGAGGVYERGSALNVQVSAEVSDNSVVLSLLELNLDNKLVFYLFYILC